MVNKFGKTIFYVLGFLFLFAGVAGLFLPFLQGILFILIGIYLLSLASENFRYRVHKVRMRWPKIHDKMLSVENRVEIWFEKHFGQKS